MLSTIASVLISIVCILYFATRWKKAEEKRDVDHSLRPLAGVFKSEKNVQPFGIFSGSPKKLATLDEEVGNMNKIKYFDQIDEEIKELQTYRKEALSG